MSDCLAQGGSCEPLYAAPPDYQEIKAKLDGARQVTQEHMDALNVLRPKFHAAEARLSAVEEALRKLLDNMPSFSGGLEGYNLAVAANEAREALTTITGGENAE